MIWTKKTIEDMQPIWDAAANNMMDWLMGKDKEVEQSKKENNEEENKIQ